MKLPVSLVAVQVYIYTWFMPNRLVQSIEETEVNENALFKSHGRQQDPAGDVCARRCADVA